MKKILATVCLFLIGGMTVSLFSPVIHQFLFHGGNECSHGHSKFPCPDHEKNPSDEKDSETCAVVLFGKSVDVAVAIDPLNKPYLLLEEILSLCIQGVETLDIISNRWARGPPSVG